MEKMTVKECFENALALIPDLPEENQDLEKFAPVWCSILLAETVNHENIWRRANKIPEISAVPKVEKPGDEIPYNDELVRAAFPYGMARWIFRENEDIPGSHEYYQLYAIALSEATPLEYAEVRDIYA